MTLQSIRSSRLNTWKNRLFKGTSIIKGGFHSLPVRMLPDVTIQLPISAHRQFWHGIHYDAPLLQFLAAELPDNGNYFDIGANIGIYDATLWKAKTGKVNLFAFEPIPTTVKVLKEVMVLNQVKAQIEPIALSNVSGSLTLSAYENGANNFWVKDIQKSQIPTITVSKSSLDEWIAQQTNCAPNAMKIDVEGHELDVLKGAKETLKEHKPALVIECHCASWDMLDVSRQEFIDVMNSLGYRKMTDRNGDPIDFLNQDSTIHLLCRA